MKQSTERSERPELPTGLMSRMAHDTRAMDGFFSLSEDRKAALLAYIQGSETGEQAKGRIEEAIAALEARAWL